MTLASVRNGFYSGAKTFSSAVEMGVKGLAKTTNAATSVLNAVTSSGSMVWGAAKFITGTSDFINGWNAWQQPKGKEPGAPEPRDLMCADFEMGAFKAFGSSVWAIGTVGNWLGATGIAMGGAKLFAGAVNAAGRVALSYTAPLVSYSLKGATAAAILGAKGAAGAIELAFDRPAIIPNAALTLASLSCLYVACSQGVAAADAKGWHKILPTAKACAGFAGTCICAALIL